MSKHDLTWQAAAFGAIAGMRASSAPALLSNHYCKHPANLKKSRLNWFCSAKTSGILSAMAAGEVLGDKLPAAPDRIAPAGLIGRAVSGGLAGTVLDKATGSRHPYAPWIGAGAAIAAAFASFYTRKALSERIADRKVAVMEDLLVYGVGALLTRSLLR